MKVNEISIRNFRRLEDVSIQFEEEDTVFVGPNNSGKTSATAVFRCFVAGKDFRVHDLSVARMADLDKFGMDGDEGSLPAIELDIWFSIDPSGIEFGRAFSLLPRLSDEFDRLGIRMRYSAVDSTKMRAEYTAAYPLSPEGVRGKRLSQYLAMDRNLKRHFDVSFLALEDSDGELVATPLDKKEGTSILQSLLKVDFVDAQRNIDDDEGHRSNRLSAAFATFYRKNLEQADVASAAHEVIDENNRKLTEHYASQFEGIMKVIRGLGVPSINDRELKIVSSLSPEAALQGNTELLYVDAHRNHELPELYNGLGFKNLIYMAIQARHFHSQWIRTAKNRPLCQIIFIEEPEVHLHAQVQQTFIANIWQVIAASAKEAGDESLAPQLVVTTHSSHILDTVDFSKVRYFRRCALGDENPDEPKILNASQVHSLRNFKPDPMEVGDEHVTSEQALEFLKRYLKLTHCDLFFADAAILVEGSVEKLLLPSMIDKTSPRLRTVYLTTLEVGGAYAHRFAGLLAFLKIPYLIVTDLDSVEAAGRHPACRADQPGALTSNASLKELLSVQTVADLLALTSEQKSSADNNLYVTFQTDVTVNERDATLDMRPRTIEESFAYQNFHMVRNGEISLGIDIPPMLDASYQVIYDRIRSSGFKKTDFAMSVLAGPDNWLVPNYISEGLIWLENRLLGPAPDIQSVHE
ncbi:MAG: AAA family ATPase [Hyphomonas oceanitis]|uniref:ATP-dependent nuclease n=1 Tax=Hyphomonas oceanitis TaxID=81033 RepID=UPI003001BC2F